MRGVFKIILMLAMGFIATVIAALWQNHRMALQNFLYPIESYVYRALGNCDVHGPVWMEKVLDHSFDLQGGISAQLSFSRENVFISCVRGVAAPMDVLIERQASVKAPFGRATLDMDYRYASMTKLITASALLRLVDAGATTFDAPLLSFFPEITKDIANKFRDPRITNITLQDLLNHQAGFNRIAANGDPMFVPNRAPWCPNDLTQLASEQLSFAPGEGVNYSNLGYCLLGEVISRVTGKSFKSYIEETFSLHDYSIRFAKSSYGSNEVAYDFRFETDYNNNYLSQFDFEAIASSAGLMGSAKVFNQLLRDQYPPFPAVEKLRAAEQHCKDKSLTPCYYQGAQIYRESDDDFVILVHEGYLPGAASVAVLDSYGGITVLTKSGANRPQVDSRNHWKPFLYNQLKNYYAEEGLVAKTNHSRH